MDYSLPGSSVHGDSPGKNNGGGCHALPQGIFGTESESLTSPALVSEFSTITVTLEALIIGYIQAKAQSYLRSN